MARQYKAAFGDAEVVIETGKLAQQAGGAVTVRLGDSMVLVTATASRNRGRGSTFFRSPSTMRNVATLQARSPGAFSSGKGAPRRRRSSSAA